MAELHDDDVLAADDDDVVDGIEPPSDQELLEYLSTHPIED